MGPGLTTRLRPQLLVCCRNARYVPAAPQVLYIASPQSLRTTQRNCAAPCSDALPITVTVERFIGGAAPLPYSAFHTTATGSSWHVSGKRLRNSKQCMCVQCSGHYQGTTMFSYAYVRNAVMHAHITIVPVTLHHRGLEGVPGRAAALGKRPQCTRQCLQSTSKHCRHRASCKALSAAITVSFGMGKGV